MNDWSDQVRVCHALVTIPSELPLISRVPCILLFQAPTLLYRMSAMSDCGRWFQSWRTRISIQNSVGGCGEHRLLWVMHLIDLCSCGVDSNLRISYRQVRPQLLHSQLLPSQLLLTPLWLPLKLMFSPLLCCCLRCCCCLCQLLPPCRRRCAHLSFVRCVFSVVFIWALAAVLLLLVVVAIGNNVVRVFLWDTFGSLLLSIRT